MKRRARRRRVRTADVERLSWSLVLDTGIEGGAPRAVPAGSVTVYPMISRSLACSRDIPAMIDRGRPLVRRRASDGSARHARDLCALRSR